MILSQREAQEQLEEIKLRGRDLTDWEEKFIDSVSRQDTLSYAQRETIDHIHTERVR